MTFCAVENPGKRILEKKLKHGHVGKTFLSNYLSIDYSVCLTEKNSLKT